MSERLKVRIDAGGREVEIECGSENVSPEQVADKVLAMWQATDGVKPPSDGPGSYGFIAADATGGDIRGQYPLQIGEGKPVPTQARIDE